MTRTRLLRWLLACRAAASAASAAAVEPAAIDFNRDIRPLLSGACFACHGPDGGARQADLRLDLREGATADLGGHAAIVPGEAAASALVARITSTDDAVRMPPPGNGTPLTADQIALLRRWIDAGAAYARHWAYEPPAKAEIPATSRPAWVVHPIDAFVLARLDAVGLQPSPPADRAALARRVAVAVTGLPPTWDEVQEFLLDNRPEAYETFVDRQLAKPTYGERWSRSWLDLARYADSAGYADDPLRTIWAYRDYVIRSFNANKPFDQFTIEQIAGDLLPDPTEEQRVATAFHRNTMTNNEGGTNDEQFRNEAIVDRVNTTMAAWMGATMACAQCHDHKYDPLTQAEYFALFDFFNQTQDADRTNESPTLALWPPGDEARRHALEQEQAALRAEAEGEGFAAEARQERLATLDKLLQDLKPTTTVPVLQEVAPDQRRATRIQLRGNYQNLGDAVAAGVPAVFPPLADEAPRNRLGLARWLVARSNPLTARVVVNRTWEELFGTGIVATSEEFGSQGDLPTHPELLDWLAVDLMEHGWDLKRLVKQLVTSAVYRQDSRSTPESVQRDPDNRLLARGPRFRVPAEMVRDQALASAGLLSGKLYGPPVHPPQPALGLRAAFGSETDWETSSGEDRYRRAIYTAWRRSNPYPSLATFDAPNREVCTLKRSRTNTPLQALVTLNDPAYVEAAQALARRMATQPELADRLVAGFRAVLLRSPQPSELQRLESLYRQAHARLAERPAEASALAADPLGPLGPDQHPLELAALTIVANTLLNLDEFLMPL